VIVVTVMGGLGNQMFQYATGRALSERTGRRLVLDTTMMPSGAPPYVRAFLLHGLPIDGRTRVIGRTLGALAGTGSRMQPFVADVRAVLRGALRRRTVSEPAHGHGPAVDLRTIPDRLAILYGYWQSPAYFEDSAALIRRELLPPIADDSAVAQLLRRLDQHDIIAVHARRGDYATLDHVARVFGTLDADHFVTMGTRIAEQCDRPAMVVLCEDTDWAKRHIRFDAPTFYAEESAPLSAVEGMALLSRAQHHVLSNSSYSWWGAWLADHPDQMVIRPRRWFSDEAIDETSRWPDDWTIG
jgi:hypothetical protein